MLTPLLTAALAASTPSLGAIGTSPEGTWRSLAPAPGRFEPDATEIEVTFAPGSEAEARVRMTLQGQTIDLDARWSPPRLAAESEYEGYPATIELVFETGDGERLVGRAEAGPYAIDIDATRFDPAEVTVVPMPLDYPHTASREGLPHDLGEAVDRAVLDLMSEQSVVGLSFAFARGGAVVDARHYGFEDHAKGVVASEKTLYRWASISKPMTAVRALQLVESGDLALEMDVREMVPEFPEKRWPVTPLQLLTNQSGVVHYRNMTVRPEREYESEHPYEDRVLALDMFKHDPLLFEPGTRYHYSTPGFSLLGAVIERAGGATFREQVLEHIAQPLGMDSLQPDFIWEPVPHRTAGYTVSGEQVVQQGDDDISWKLPAGGWMSTAEDLARFGAGLLGDEILSDSARHAMFEPARLADGSVTSYGMGIRPERGAGLTFVQHGGAQQKTATHLLVAVEPQLVVAVMCNTQGTSLIDLATGIMELLVASSDAR